MSHDESRLLVNDATVTDALVCEMVKAEVDANSTASTITLVFTSRFTPARIGTIAKALGATDCGFRVSRTEGKNTIVVHIPPRAAAAATVCTAFVSGGGEAEGGAGAGAGLKRPAPSAEGGAGAGAGLKGPAPSAASSASEIASTRANIQRLLAAKDRTRIMAKLHVMYAEVVAAMNGRTDQSSQSGACVLDVGGDDAIDTYAFNELQTRHVFEFDNVSISDFMLACLPADTALHAEYQNVATWAAVNLANDTLSCLLVPFQGWGTNDDPINWYDGMLHQFAAAANPPIDVSALRFHICGLGMRLTDAAVLTYLLSHAGTDLCNTLELRAVDVARLLGMFQRVAWHAAAAAPPLSHAAAVKAESASHPDAPVSAYVPLFSEYVNNSMMQNLLADVPRQPPLLVPAADAMDIVSPADQYVSALRAAAPRLHATVAVAVAGAGAAWDLTETFVEPMAAGGLATHFIQSLLLAQEYSEANQIAYTEWVNQRDAEENEVESEKEHHDEAVRLCGRLHPDYINAAAAQLTATQHAQYCAPVVHKILDVLHEARANLGTHQQPLRISDDTLAKTRHAARSLLDTLREAVLACAAVAVLRELKLEPTDARWLTAYDVVIAALRHPAAVPENYDMAPHNFKDNYVLTSRNLTRTFPFVEPFIIPVIAPTGRPSAPPPAHPASPPAAWGSSSSSSSSASSLAASVVTLRVASRLTPDGVRWTLRNMRELRQYGEPDHEYLPRSADFRLGPYGNTAPSSISAHPSLQHCTALRMLKYEAATCLPTHKLATSFLITQYRDAGTGGPPPLLRLTDLISSATNHYLQRDQLRKEFIAALVNLSDRPTELYASNVGGVQSAKSTHPLPFGQAFVFSHTEVVLSVRSAAKNAPSQLCLLMLLFVPTGSVPAAHRSFVTRQIETQSINLMEVVGNNITKLAFADNLTDPLYVKSRRGVAPAAEVPSAERYPAYLPIELDMYAAPQ